MRDAGTFMLLGLATVLFLEPTVEPRPQPEPQLVAMVAPKPEDHKPEPYVEPELIDIDNIDVPAPPPLDEAAQLYDKAMSYYSSGGKRWYYRINGVLASKERLIDHLISEHSDLSRDELERFDHNTLQWIHSYYHTQERHVDSATTRYEWRRFKLCGSNGCKYVWRRVPVE